MTDQEKKPKPRSTSRVRSVSGEKVRPSFYAGGELLNEIEIQAKQDKENKSSLLEKLVGQLLESSNGKQMRARAARHERSLATELGLLLSAFYERLPLDEIEVLAEESQRDAYQMVAFLALQGLNAYKQKEKEE